MRGFKCAKDFLTVQHPSVVVGTVDECGGSRGGGEAHDFLLHQLPLGRPRTPVFAPTAGGVNRNYPRTNVSTAPFDHPRHIAGVELMMIRTVLKRDRVEPLLLAAYVDTGDD
jgi:hypothetical protein